MCIVVVLRLVIDVAPRTPHLVRRMECLETASSTVTVYVNGREVNIEQPDPETTLLYFLRNDLRLTGSKLGCGEGGCGACTVMVSSCERGDERVRHVAVNACLTPLCSVAGMAVTTVEGIGSTRTKLHPVQERIARAHGSQCGFCTPGFVMSMYTLLRNNPTPSEEEVEAAFDGNLCRCTGYRPILEGYKTFANSQRCCQSRKDGKCCLQQGNDKGSSHLFDESEFTPLDPSQEPIFPPALQLREVEKPLAVKGPRVQWYRPSTLQQLLVLRDKFPHHTSRQLPKYRIVAGNTEIGVETKFKGEFYEILLCVSHVPELKRMEEQEGGLLVGAAVSLNTLNHKLSKMITKLPEYKTRAFSALLEMLRWFAGQQIRNTATIGGNICNASPISDLNPVLMACGAKLNLASKGSTRVVKLDYNFFLDYKRTSIKPDEILVSIFIPFTEQNEYVFSYKQSRRREDDLAIVNAGLRVVVVPRKENGEINEVQWKISDCTLAYGGMSKTTVMASNTQKALIGRDWNEATLQEATCLLSEELQLPADVPGGMPEYRKSLVTSFFFKFFLTVSHLLSPHSLPPQLQSATQPYTRSLARSTQGFQRVPSSQKVEDTIGRPVMQLSAPQQATGEARYLDDIPRLEGELYAGLVLSERAHAHISVDPSAALAMEGVMDYVSVSDVPGDNMIGIGNDEPVFADGKVISFGQIIGIVLAPTQPLAQRAAKAVRVTYEDIHPSIITIEDAIAAGEFIGEELKVECGDVDKALSEAEHVLEGECRVGGQDHFYLETQACLVVPKGEENEVEIVSSTQGVSAVQTFASRALGIPRNRIVSKVKKIGGGFGGKETRSYYVSTAVAVAANKVQRPVRVMLDRNEDMMSSGGRHPFLGLYKVGFTSEGRVTALHLKLYSNGGISADLSIPVMERAVTHGDSVYKIPNYRAVGRICRTNLPPNTAFRGFGGPQGMIITEQLMQRVVEYLKLPSEQVRRLNFYHDGDVTPYGQVQPSVHITRCWDTLLENTAYFSKWRSSVDHFNKSNKWKKRGLAIIPNKYCLAFGITFLNQAGALLHVYTDGSVLLSHGGMEMGQGLHTKMVQVCSHCLNLPIEKIHISETSTDKVPNSSPTAASVSTDMYGMAVKNCCDQIMERLKPFREADPTAGWEKWVERAYLERVNLSAQGFYKTPDLWFDWSTGKGNMYSYFSFGASASEVEVDTLTGDFTILRSDLVMDVGDSLNPAIDIGQVEGAFTQGVGLFTMEQCVYLEGNGRTQHGQPYTTGPGTYKIPACSDIPVQLNVTLLDRTSNPKAIFSSKAVGEPPLFLAASVLFAIRDAVCASRAERGITAPFNLDTPATCEAIRMACEDQFTEQAREGIKDTAKRWTVDV